MIAPAADVLAQQRIYRALLNAFARPGAIEAASRTAIARTLLDHETSFAVVGAAADAEAFTLRRLTNARPTAVAHAAFVFASGDPTAALQLANGGTLEAPHEGATVVIDVDDVTNGAAFALAGPGVDGERTVRIAAPFDWWTPRSARVREFPLGIDLLLIDRGDRFLAIPRSTQVRRFGGV